MMSTEDQISQSAHPNKSEPGPNKPLKGVHTVQYHVQRTESLQTSSLLETTSCITDDQFRIIQSVLHRMQEWHKKGQGGLDFRPNLVVFTGTEARLVQRNNKQIDDHFIKHNHQEAVQNLLYIAPEVIRGINTDDSASEQNYLMSDIWSFACFCLYIVSKRDPEYYRNDREGKRRLVNEDRNAFVTLTFTIGEGQYLPEYSSYCNGNSALASFFRDCFQFDPRKRPSADDLGKSVLQLGIHYNDTVEHYMQHSDSSQASSSSAPRSTMTDELFRIVYSVLRNMHTYHEKGKGGLEFRPDLVIFTGKEARLAQRNTRQLDDYFVKHNHHEAIRSLLYTSPEGIRGIKRDDLASVQLADIWSFACFCLYVVSGRDPEYYRNDRQGKKRLLNDDRNAFVTLTLTIGEGQYVPEYLTYCKENFALESFFRDCFQLDPRKRPGADRLSESVLPACARFASLELTHPAKRIKLETEFANDINFQPGIVMPLELISVVRHSPRFGVSKAKRQDTNEIVAVMNVPLTGETESRNYHLSLIKAKMDLVKGLHHPNLVRHIHWQENQVALADLRVEHIYQIIMEFCDGGRLDEFIKTFTITPTVLQKWTKQIVDGLAYLHDNRFVHCDIKGGNILLSSNNPDMCVVKITDYSSITRLVHGDNHVEEPDGSFTPTFASPEMVLGTLGIEDCWLAWRELQLQESFEHCPEMESPNTENRYAVREGRLGRPTDIWSMGCVVIEMLTGARPQFHKDGKTIIEDMAVLYFVGTGGAPTIPAPLPDAVDDFVRQCLQRNPDNRPRGHELKKHPMLTASESDISGWVLPPRNLPLHR